MSHRNHCPMGFLLAVLTTLSATACGRRHETPQPKPTPRGPAAQVTVREVPLGAQMDNVPTESFVVSPDGRRLAFAVAAGGRWAVVVDGAKGTEYEQVQYFHRGFSPDGRHFAYAAQKQGQWVVVQDGVEDRESWKHVSDVCYSPTGQLLYLSGKGEAMHLIDGTAGEYQEVMSIVTRTFTTDGMKSSGGALVFSPDGKRRALIASKDGKQYFAVVDGVQGKPYSQFSSLPAFSRNGRSVLYTVQAKGRMMQVVDGVEGPAWDEVKDAIFSADGARAAYAARKGTKWRVVVDGREMDPADDVRSLAFSPDGKSLAYCAKAGAKWRVVRDGQAIAEHDEADGTAFGPSGQLVYTAKTGKRWRLVAGTSSHPEFDSVGTPVFSLDGKHLAYPAQSGEKWRVVADGTPGREYAYVREVVFNGDGTHWATLARRGENNEKNVLVVDNLEAPVEFGVLGQAMVVFGDPTHLHVIVSKGKTFARLEATVVETIKP